MPKVIMICGKLCSGKTTYARKLQKDGKAVILSIDEIMLAVFGLDSGEKHDDYVARIKRYLYQKTLEIINNDLDVILDWGFWTKEERAYARSFFGLNAITNELHFIDIDDCEWHRRIEKRNQEVLAYDGNAYYVDDGLLEKFNAIFEEPDPSEIDYRIK